MKDTGGMAFPGFESVSGYGSSKPAVGCEGWENYQTGMTLRDWFAGLAMQGILSVPDCEYAYQWTHPDGEVRLLGHGKTPASKPGGDWAITRTPSEALAKQAYFYADHMLAERQL